MLAQRWNASWRRFANLTQRAAFRHVCVFTDKARQADARGKQVYVPRHLTFIFLLLLPLFFFSSPLFSFKASVLVVPESKAKESRSRFFHSGPAERDRVRCDRATSPSRFSAFSLHRDQPAPSLRVTGSSVMQAAPRSRTLAWTALRIYPPTVESFAHKSKP